MPKKPKPLVPRRVPVYEALRAMPPLSHWPHKPAPWKSEESAVLRFIVDLIPTLMPEWSAKHPGELEDEARRILDNAWRPGRHLVYDSEANLWTGVDFVPTAARNRNSGFPPGDTEETDFRRLAGQPKSTL